MKATEMLKQLSLFYRNNRNRHRKIKCKAFSYLQPKIYVVYKCIISFLLDNIYHINLNKQVLSNAERLSFHSKNKDFTVNLP